jgi:hypothetical protein
MSGWGANGVDIYHLLSRSRIVGKGLSQGQAFDFSRAVAFHGRVFQPSPHRHEPLSENSGWGGVPDRFGIIRGMCSRP